MVLFGTGPFQIRVKLCMSALLYSCDAHFVLLYYPYIIMYQLMCQDGFDTSEQSREKQQASLKQGRLQKRKVKPSEENHRKKEAERHT